MYFDRKWPGQTKPDTSYGRSLSRPKLVLDPIQEANRDGPNTCTYHRFTIAALELEPRTQTQV